MRRPWTGLRRRPAWQQLRLEQLECRLVPTVSLLNNFDAMNVFTGQAVPPDTCGAVGPNSYVETVNSAVTIYNKTTNAIIAQDNLSDFLYTKGGISSNGGLYDATMAYDEVTGQFIVGDLDVAWPTGGGSAAALDIAVSKTSNPTTLDKTSWNFYKIDMTEPNEEADYPGNMGFNADAFCFTFNMFAANGFGSNHVEVAALNQSSLAAGASNVLSGRFDETNTFSLRPVTMHGSTAGGPMWFVAEHGDNRSIDLLRVDSILTHPTTSTFNVSVNSYGNINAPRNPDGSVITTNLDTRIYKAAEANNEIVACQAVGVGTNEDDARWYEFNVSNINSPTLSQQGNVGFGAKTYTVYPAIDINSSGDIGMGFTKSGNDTSTDYMSTYVTGQTSSDPSGTMETPVLVRAGDSNNTDGREGDFSGINVDSDGSFWAADEWGYSGSWGTEVAHFSMNSNSQSFPVVNGQLQILGDQLGSNYNDSATVEVNSNGGVEAILNGQTVNFSAGQITSILIALGGGNNTTNLLATPSGVTTYIVGGGTDTVNVGGGTTQNILADVNIEDPTATSTVIVNDSTDTGARTVTVSTLGTNPADSQSNSDPWGQISGLLGSGNINFEYGDTSSLTINGSNAASTYNIQATGITTTVNGGAGSDTFNLGSSNSLGALKAALTINGGGGTNTLTANDSGSTSGQSYTLSKTTLGGSNFTTITYASLSTLNVTGSGNDTLTISSSPGVPTITTNFDGGSGTNTLQGANVTNTWTISGANSGKLDSVNFSDFQNLTGGSANDTFNFTKSTAGISGTLNGGTGTNKISYSTLGSSFLVNVTLTSDTAGTAPLITGGFSSIGSLAGSTDTANTLNAPNLVNYWTISSANGGKLSSYSSSGKLLGSFSFTGMPNLVGSANVDDFKFSTTSGKVLSINGNGAPAGQGDWLDYSAFGSTTTVTVNLATGSATNVNSGTGGAITGIQNVVGSAKGTNNLTGSSQGNILIGGSGSNTLTGGSGNSLLIGGSGSGTITGGSGTDILIAGTTTYSATTTAATGRNSLMAILAELQSSDTFAQVVSCLINGNNSGGGSDLNGKNKLTWGGASPTVKPSTGTFTLSGDSGAGSNPADWFFCNSSSTVSDFDDDNYPTVQDEHNNNAIGIF